MTPQQCQLPKRQFLESPCSQQEPVPTWSPFMGFVCGEEYNPQFCGGESFSVAVNGAIFRLCQYHYPALYRLISEQGGGPAEVTTLPASWSITHTAMIDVQAIIYGAPWVGVSTDLVELINASVCLRLPDLRDICIREILRPESFGEVSAWWQQSEHFPESVYVTRRVLIHAISRRYSLLDVKPLLHDIRTVRRADVERFVRSGEMLEIVSKYFLHQFICKVNRWVAEGDHLRVWRLLAHCGHVLTRYGLRPGSFLYKTREVDKPCPNRLALLDMARLLQHGCMSHSPDYPLKITDGIPKLKEGDLETARLVPLHNDPEILQPSLVIISHPEPCIRPWEDRLSKNCLRILALPLSKHEWNLTIGLYPEKLKSSSNMVTMEHFIIYTEWRPNTTIRRLTMCSLRWHGEADVLVWTPRFLSSPSWKYRMKKQGIDLGTMSLDPLSPLSPWRNPKSKAAGTTLQFTSTFLALDGTQLYEFAQTPVGSIITTFDLKDMEVGPTRFQGTTAYSHILTFGEQSGPEIFDKVLCVVARAGFLYVLSLNGHSIVLVVYDVDASKVVRAYTIRDCDYEVRASRAIFIKNDLYVVTSVGDVFRLGLTITGDLTSFEEILQIPHFCNRKDFHLACHLDWLYVFGSNKKTRSLRKTACYGVNVQTRQLSILSMSPPFANVIGGAVMMLCPQWMSPLFPTDCENLEWRRS